MIPALTFESINEQCKYGNKDSVVCIMIALYTDEKVKNIISQQYDFWHFYTQRGLNMYWLGYGAYYFPNLPGQHLVDGVTCVPSVYFDTSIFTKEMVEIQKYVEFKYKGQIGILVSNYKNNKLHLEESTFINLTPLLGKNDQRLQNFAMYLIDECKENNNIYDFTYKLKIKKYLYGIRDIKIADLISIALGLFEK